MGEREDSLSKLRREIDEIDAELLALMNRRARVAQSVGALKQTRRRDFFRPEREAQVLRRLAAMNDGPLAREQIAFVFRELISACLALEVHLKVGYARCDERAGERAVRERFGRSIDAVPVEDARQLFGALDAGAVDFAVLPAGPLSPTQLEWLRRTSMTICADGVVDGLGREPTRYWVVGALRPPPSGMDRTTVLIEVGREDGGIDQALEPFTRGGVDLARVEPVEGDLQARDRVACVEAAGHAEDEPLVSVLDELRRRGRLVRVLGSYPCGDAETVR